MKKIKVLHIIKSLGRGGAETLLPETLDLHDKTRFEFHYIYFLPWKDQMHNALEEKGGIVKCFSATNNLLMLLKKEEVIYYCKENNIDIIHCHLPWSGFLGRLIHRKTRIPVLYTEHNIQERYHFITKLINRLTFNNQNLALGVSEDVTSSIERNIKPKIDVRTLLNGVNTKKFKREGEKARELKISLGIPSTAVVIGNIAVFRQQKNILGWIKAFNELIKENLEVYGLLVGAGPEETEIKEYISKLGLENKIILPGLQTDTKPYFSAIDIFMLSSDFEGLPIALLEAMSMECAVVATNAGGVGEVIQNGKNGLLCDTGNWQELSRNCKFLLEDAVRRKAFQKAAREKVDNKFSLGNMVTKLEEYYIKLHRCNGDS